MTAGSTCMTDYIENRIINTFLRGLATTSASCYVGLFNSTTASGYESGSPMEVSSGLNYTRMTASGPGFVSTLSTLDGGPIPPPDPIIVLQPWAVSGGSATNNYEIVFPTGTFTWGNINGIGLSTGSANNTTGSRLYFYSSPETILAPTSALQFVIPAYSMQIIYNDAYSIYLGNALLDWFLNSQEIEQPGKAVEIALYTTLPNRYGQNGTEVATQWDGISLIVPGGGSGEETLGGTQTLGTTGYYRKQIAGVSVWSTPFTGSSGLLIPITWTALGDWGWVEGWGIHERVHTNLLFRGYLDRPRLVLMGDTFTINSFRISLS